MSETRPEPGDKDYWTRLWYENYARAQISLTCWAWQFLRFNPDYRREWAERKAEVDARSPWGPPLPRQFIEDPSV